MSDLPVIEPPLDVDGRATAASRVSASVDHDAEGSASGAAEPVLWLGARPSGGLEPPSPVASSQHLCAPRGVWLDDHHLIVADTGNHRVMIWHEPARRMDHAPADVVLGQPHVASGGPQASGRGPQNGMQLPTGVAVVDGALLVADAWNHRVLIWHVVPTISDTPPDLVIGQPDASSVSENRGGPCSPGGMYWPSGVAMIDGRVWVADTGNRRIVAFDGVPDPGAAPVFVLGQPDAWTRDENRSGIAADSFRRPQGIAGDGRGAFVADAGNHRVLGWSTAPHGDVPADMVFGQADFVSAVERPHAPQSAASVRFPADVAIEPVTRRMAVGDSANNRVLVWTSIPTASGSPADHVLGQLSTRSIGENRWDLVGRDTLCRPSGVSLHDDLLAVADSGNNRVMLWRLGG